SVESKEQIEETARAVKKAGAICFGANAHQNPRDSDCAHVLRGGTYKARTSPYGFQGLGEEGIKLLEEAGKKAGIPVISEILNEEQARAAALRIDALQIGARNMQNFTLLKEAGKLGKPVLLKRGFACSLEELLCAAEYLLVGGSQVILCLRGIRTFETETRFTFDVGSLAPLRELTHLPIIVDVSHPAGKREYVASYAKAALAAGADGIMVEVHPQPEKALSDGAQSLTPKQFEELMVDLKKLAHAIRP
ncbi:MAG: 3-deoxy-7-phosphoheptulonate synthase, partial [Candidatus Micrarchaeota archaeon]